MLQFSSQITLRKLSYFSTVPVRVTFWPSRMDSTVASWFGLNRQDTPTRNCASNGSGLIALSTYLPMTPAQAQAALKPEAASQPVFMAHGQFDPVVPYAGGDMSANALRALGFEVEWHRYPMQHAVCAEEIRDLGDWMTARFAAG